MSCRPPPFDERARSEAAHEDDEHGRQHKGIASEDGECNARRCESEDTRIMLRVIHPLLHKDDNKESRHCELNTLRIDGEACAHKTADRRTRNPVELVEEGHKEHEPARIDALRNLRRVVDGEGFIAHAIDEIGLLPPCAAVLLKHRDAVEDMASLHHECEQEGLQRGKGAEEECRCNEFERAAEDERTHRHRIPEREARDVCIDAVGESEEEEACENRQGIGEGGAQSDKAWIAAAHDLLQSQSSVCAARMPIACSVE